MQNMEKRYHIFIILSLLTTLFFSCKNREINPYQAPGDNYTDLPIDGIESHFQRIWIDEMEYFILERDRNNPHEGFGFMALKGNRIANKQDSLLVYLQVSMENQAEILALLKRTNAEVEMSDIQSRVNQKLANQKFLPK